MEIRNKIQQLIKSIKTTFYSYIGNNKKRKMFLKKVKRFLGFQDFLDFSTLKSELSKEYDVNFENAEFHIILYENELKTWIISTNDKIWFVLDDGLKYKTKSVLKSEFNYSLEDLINDNSYGKLLIDQLEFPILFDKNLTGQTGTFETKINNFKSE